MPKEETKASSLKERTARGLIWGLLSNGSMQLLNLIIGIFLARLLTPSDYGIVGVLTIFSLIAGSLQSAGFSQALINLRRPTDDDYNSVFWFNITVSATMYVILFACAPLIALYFRQDCLVGVSRLVFVTLILSAVGIVPAAWLQKRLMVREAAITSISALVISGCVGIALALKGMAYWSLAWQQVTYNLVVCTMRLYFCRWRPSLHIDMRPAWRMKNFAVKILLTSILNVLSQNILTFIFGRLFPMRAVGAYTQANKWGNMAYSLISGTLSQVAQTVMVEADNEGGTERDIRVFRKLTRFASLLSFPALLGLALVADEFITLMLTDKWSACVPMLRIICVGGAFMPLYTLYQNLIISKGRSDIYMWCTAVHIFLQIGVVIALAKQGIMVMITVYTALNIIYLAVWQLCAHRLIGLHTRHVMLDTVPFLLAAAVVMALTWLVTMPIHGLLPLLVGRIVIAAVVYLVVMRLTGAKILKEAVEQIRGR